VKVEKMAKNGQMVQNCYPLSPAARRASQHWELVVLYNVRRERESLGAVYPPRPDRRSGLRPRQAARVAVDHEMKFSSKNANEEKSTGKKEQISKYSRTLDLTFYVPRYREKNSLLTLAEP
jgi:hypothetical protein